MTSEEGLSLAADVRRAVVDHYLKTGNSADAPTIAAGLGWPERKVREVLRLNFGAIPGTHAQQEARASYSKNYPGMQSGSHRVWCYLPSLSTLREIIVGKVG